MLIKMLVVFFQDILKAILNFVQTFGYTGICVMTFIESTFIPIPSEFTLIPAGYLVAKGDMQITLVFLFSIIGTLLGSFMNYIIAYHFGRKLFVKYGKYFFLKPSQLLVIETFFNQYGAISTFFGRMLPGIKHFISFPAGLAKMDLRIFTIYTFLGSSMWLSFLLYLGYIIGTNEALISSYIKGFNIFVISTALIVVFITGAIKGLKKR